MFGSAATLTRNSRLLPGLLGYWVGKLGWLVGYLVRCLFAWWVCCLAGRLAGEWFGWLLGLKVVLVVGWLGWFAACFGWLVWLNPPTPGPKPRGPHRGKWEGAWL